MERPGARGEAALAGLQMLDAAPAPAHVPQYGQRTYRRGIRSRGPVMALVLPTVLGVVGLLMLRDNVSTARGIGGFVATLLAAPLLPAFGAPIRSGGSVYLGAAVGSAVIWLAVGALASRRATRRPIATWGAYWGEYLLLAASVWAGVLVSVVVANLVLGRALL